MAVMLDAQGEADWLLSKCKGDAPGARSIVRAHLGPGSILEVAMLPIAPAKLSDRDGRPIIMVRPRLLPEIERWYILHELAEWRLQALDYREHDAEQQADAIAAALVMPRRAFLAELRHQGRRFSRLAKAFVTSETAVSLRYGETTTIPTAVIDPYQVRTRGDEYGWPAPPVLRGLAQAKRLPRDIGIERLSLRDDKRRRVLIAG